MKTLIVVIKSIIQDAIFLALLFCLLFLATRTDAEDAISTNACPDDLAIKLIRTMRADQPHGNPNETFILAFDHRQKVVQAFLAIFNDPKSDRWAKSNSARFLGELRAAEAADILAANITLEDATGHHVIFEDVDVAANALIRIGNPAIPAVMRNLAENDNGFFRYDSLLVLASIDNDKEVTQFRLERAIRIETNPEKRKRLAESLKILPDISIRRLSWHF